MSEYNNNNGNNNDFNDYFNFQFEPQSPKNKKDDTPALLKSNRILKVWCIVLCVLMIASIIVSAIYISYLERNRPKITVSTTSEIGEAVAINTIYSVCEVQSVGQSTTSSGSGFLISASASGSYIMTNKHVIDNAITVNSNSFSLKGDIYIKMYKGDKTKATVVSIDSKYDFAILKVSGILNSLYKPVEFAGTNKLNYAEFVLAIGNPLGYGISVTQGIISVPKTFITVDSVNVDVIQIDAAINQGNSGGPLFNKDSCVIGINTYKKGATTGSTIVPEGMGYAITTELIIEFINTSRLGFNVGIKTAE